MKNNTRIAISSLIVSASVLVGIATHEGYKSDAYIPVKGDVPTIGYGQTKNVKLGDKTTPDRALIDLLKTTDKFSNEIKQCIHVPLYQNEFDAYLSFSYNVGTNAFCKSTLVKKLNQQDYNGACDQLLKWTFYKGKDCKLIENKKLCGGLAKRRLEEYKLCKTI